LPSAEFFFAASGGGYRWRARPNQVDLDQYSFWLHKHFLDLGAKAALGPFKREAHEERATE
jgi:hypothetical protein